MELLEAAERVGLLLLALRGPFAGCWTDRMSETDEQPPPKFRAVGKQVTVWPRAKIVNAGRISVGDRVIIDDFVLLIGGEDTRIGSFVHLAAFTSIMGGGTLFIDDFAGVSGGVRIYTGNEQYGGECLTNPTVPPPFRVARRGAVHIGKHAIIGANSVILPGVTIGEGAVIGACSLVTKNCAPWSVNLGVPARPLKKRPSAEILRLEQELRSRFYDASGAFLSPPDGA
jgi:acetyltransferase-like isoleucine patch superfamily enzyme